MQNLFPFVSLTDQFALTPDCATSTRATRQNFSVIPPGLSRWSKQPHCHGSNGRRNLSGSRGPHVVIARSGFPSDSKFLCPHYFH